MFKLIANFFDKLEDRVRIALSHKSFLYAFIGGVSHVIFWRGVWHTSDMIMHGVPLFHDYDGNPISGFWGYVFYEPFTIVWSSVIMIMSGLFVATFIGERIILSGLKKEKKVTDRTEEEVRKEENRIDALGEKINSLVADLKEIKNELAKK
jgi:hypothetical protein